jgi:hypothetical protein
MASELEPSPEEAHNMKRPPVDGSVKDVSNNRPTQRNTQFEKLFIDIPLIVTIEISRTSEIAGGLT